MVVHAGDPLITKIGKKSVFPIGIGTYGMGGKMLPNSRNDRRDVEALEFALDSGINVIDTAEMYGHGHSEELVGKAIDGRKRSRLFVIGKVLPTHLGREQIVKSVKASLSRMKTDYIDLYLIHWMLPTVNIGSAIRNMEMLVEEGYVGNIGVSNFNIGDMGKAVSAARSHRITANQIKYNLYRKRCERGLIPFCEKNNIDVIAYTPLSKGSFGSGRIEDITRVNDISRRTGKTPVQIALNYLMERSIPIPKSSNPDHIREIIGAYGWKLSKEDYDSLRVL